MIGIGIGISIGSGRASGGGGSAPIPALFQSVNADGWSVTYASPPTFDPVNSPELFTVSRAGYDATGSVTTITENLICTQRVRQVYPNQASLTADRVALSDYIYSTDTIEGVTNNSTEVSPKPVANWARPDRTIVGNTLPAEALEVVAFHRNGVACVEWTISDGTNSVTVRSSAMVVSGASTDRNAVLVYRPASDVDVSSLANPATLTVNTKVYPRIGGTASIRDSADSSVAREFSPRFHRRDTAARRVAYVRTAANGGDNATGVVSTVDATASANPFATVLAAINAHHTAGGMDGAIIYIGNDGGTPFTLASTAATRTQSHSPLTITREASVARENARVAFGSGANFRPRMGAGLLRFEDVSIVRQGTFQFQGETSPNLVVIMQDVDFNNNSHNASWLNASHDMIFGATMTGITATPLNAAGAAGVTEHRMLRGLNIAAAANTEGWLVLGCDLRSANTLTLPNGSRSSSGSIIHGNYFSGMATAARFWGPGNSLNVIGAAFVQNVVEYTSATATTAIAISADSATGSNEHIIFQHNSLAGFNDAGRSNLFYDEGSTARTSKLMSVRGNVHVQINNKGDVFVLNGARVGNWPYLYGVGCDGEFSQFIDAGTGSFAQAYPGGNASIGTSSSTRNDPLFVDSKAKSSGPTAGAGGGDYRLQSGSPAKARARRVLPFDLDGNARSELASAGAYE